VLEKRNKRKNTTKPKCCAITEDYYDDFEKGKMPIDFRKALISLIRVSVVILEALTMFLGEANYLGL